MKKEDSNKYLIIASFFAFIHFSVGHLIQLPDVIDGVCTGISISLYPIGLYSLNHDIGKLENFKRTLIRRYFK